MSADALLSIIAGRDTTGLFEVRCRRPSDGRIKAREWFALQDRGECQQFITAHAERLDVFVGVAPRTERAGGKSSIRHSWLLYVDADSAEAAERVRAFTPRPSLIVQSGTGDNCHAYWALEAPVSPAWFERANRRLAHHLGADVKVTDAARILRPPGSLNHKHSPPVTVTATSSDVAPVSVSLVKKLPDPPTRPPAKRKLRPDIHMDDPLVGISADRYYTALTGRPVTHGNVTCPFHGDGQERNPSMRLYDGGTYYCFVCCEGGSIYQFAAQLWGIGTRGADFKRLQDRLTDALD